MPGSSSRDDKTEGKMDRTKGLHEGGRRCPDRRQKQEEGGSLRPEEGQGEEGQPQRPFELALAASIPKRSEGSGPLRAPFLRYVPAIV